MLDWNKEELGVALGGRFLPAVGALDEMYELIHRSQGVLYHLEISPRSGWVMVRLDPEQTMQPHPSFETLFKCDCVRIAKSDLGTFIDFVKNDGTAPTDKRLAIHCRNDGKWSVCAYLERE